jgi:hypothetical protein
LSLRSLARRAKEIVLAVRVVVCEAMVVLLLAVPRWARAARLEVLAAPARRVYTCDMTTPTAGPEFEPDQIAQAFSVGLCLVLAAVLIVVVLV